MERFLGTMLGDRYEILSTIGVGGMAVVFRARCHVLNRLVAIKILKDEYAEDEEFRRRFYHESQAVARLSHNNIVSVYDVAQTDGVQYIVMELVDGVTLKDYLLKKGSLTWQETLFFGEQIARALEHAHARGIIHQDIKPQNIVLLHDGTAKVTDFGIARFAYKQEVEESAQAIGSVHYISPEQARGSDIDERTDLYALGIVMYELLTGKLPFDGKTVVDIVMQHINAVPARPSDYNPQIPRGMDDVVMHAMSPVLSHRYSTAREIYEDLESLKFNPQRRFSSQPSAPLVEDAPPKPVVDDRTMPLRTALENTADRRTPPPNTTAPRTTTPHTTTPRTRKTGKKQPEQKRSLLQWLGESPAVLILITILVFAVIAVSVFVSMFSKITDNQTHAMVPNLLGQQIAVVLENTEIDRYFDVVQVSTRPDAKAETGEILEQSLAKNSSALIGSKIEVVVCENPVEPEEEHYQMEDFIGADVTMAGNSLLRAGFPDYEVELEPSETVEEGKIIRTVPSKGATLIEGDPVRLYVSTGPEKKTVIMPTLTGLSVTQAIQKIEERHLVVGNAISVDSDKPEGYVLEQSVVADAVVKEGAIIDLRVSNGLLVPDPNDPVEDPDAEPVEMGYCRFNIPFINTEVDNYLTISLDGKILHEASYEAGIPQAYVEITAPMGEQELTVRVNETEWTETRTFS